MRISLRGSEARGDDLLLIFAVDEGAGEMAASVVVNQFGYIHFPHCASSMGESISPVADAALLERAAQHVALLDAAESWSAMRRRRRQR